MFRNSYQSGLFTIFYSLGSKPLAIWDSKVTNGHMRRITDEELKSLVLEIMSTNVVTAFIQCPSNETSSLGIKLPYFIMILKNLKKYFSFEIQILDDANFLRRFRFSNYQTRTKVNEFCTMVPLSLNESWNQIQLNLVEFTQKAYNTNYIETTRVKIHANTRIRRVYFTDHLYAENELPPSYKIFKPAVIQSKSMAEIRKEMVEKQQKLIDQVTITAPPGTAMEVNVSPVNSPEPEIETHPVTQRRSIDNDSKRVSFHKDKLTNSLVEGYEGRSSILKRSSIEDGINLKEVLKSSSLFLDSSIEVVPRMLSSISEDSTENGPEEDEGQEPEEEDHVSEANFENDVETDSIFEKYSESYVQNNYVNDEESDEFVVESNKIDSNSKSSIFIENEHFLNDDEEDEYENKDTLNEIEEQIDESNVSVNEVEIDDENLSNIGATVTEYKYI